MTSVADAIFIGTTSADADATFRAYRSALDSANVNWRRSIRLRHAIGDETDEAQLQRDIALMLATHPILLIAPTGSAMFAAARLRVPMPVIFASHADPRREGVVASLRRPGGRFTGVSLHDELDSKRLELLQDAYPHLRRIRVLADTFWDHAGDRHGMFARIGQRMGLHIELEHADTVAELDALMTNVRAADTDAWYVPPTYIAYLAEQAIIDHLRRIGRPSIHATVREVERGAPLAYAHDTSFAFDAMARLTLRVAAGEDPASIPVERPKRMVLAARASAAGPPIDSSVLRRADRVF